MKHKMGILAALGGALIFGFAPVLGKMTYTGGSNGIMLTFLRAAFGVPLLFVLLKVRRVPLAITRRELRDLLLVGTFGMALTTVLHYSAYEYIAVGIATVLHFFYPVVVTVASILFFKERVSIPKLAALVLSFLGITLFFEGAETAFQGVLLALASSFSYALYMIGVERTSLHHMPRLKLSFYLCVIAAMVSFVFGLCMGSITFDLTPAAWGLSILVAALVSVGALTLCQWGIQLVGASTTAILSTVEPITSVILGVLLLSEEFSLRKGMGCLLILGGVVILTLLHNHEEHQPEAVRESAEAGEP